jgi:hypothetical protein
MQSSTTVRSTFELAFLPPGRASWLFWPLLTLLLWGGIEFASRLAGEPLHLGVRIFVLGFGWLPVPLLAMARYFAAVLDQVAPVLWDDQASFLAWRNERAHRLLTLHTGAAKAVTALIFLAVVLTLWLLGAPYRSLPLSTLVLLGVLLVAWVYAQSAYMVLGLLHTLYELSRRDLRLAFFYPPGRQLAPLLHFYTTLALVLTVYHLTLVTSLWTGPYPFGLPMMIWVAVLAFFPLTVFVLSIFLIHTMIARAKYNNVQVINANVQQALSEATTDTRTESAQRLEALMGIQEKVHGIREWPLEFGSALTLLVTIAAAVAQVVVAVSEAITAT